MTTNGLQTRLARTLPIAALLCLIAGGSAYGGDSCITCHTDADLLEENLAEAPGRISALQAGSG